jgi:undecaprenyl-diphosphatase
MELYSMNGNKLKLTFVLVMGLLCLLCFFLVAWLIGEERFTFMDSRMIAIIQGFESPAWTTVMKLFTFIGSSTVVLVLSIGSMFCFYKMLHHRSEILLFMVILGGSGILNLLLKLAYHRQRPTLHRLIEQSGYSFPSGHTMEAFALYAALAFFLWKHMPTRKFRCMVIIISIFMMLAIGISRIYLGVHYPSDVIGAYLASGCWFALSVWVYQWYKEHRAKKS